jgi:hypothetical protein
VFPSWEEYVDLYCPLPSDSFLTDIFLYHYKKHENDYDEYSKRLHATALSCDHTFKVSVNIGVKHSSEPGWVTQFDSLFMVLNQKGQVLGFKFVKSRAFADIQELLVQIRENLNENGCTIDMLLLDNCCQWAQKMKGIFPKSLVRLDLFHAVQRITSTIPSRDMFRQDMVRDLRQVFREVHDNGPKRLRNTPTTPVLQAQLNTYRNKWSAVTHEGANVLGDKTVDAIRNLMKHVDKGCLSGIPQGWVQIKMKYCTEY